MLPNNTDKLPRSCLLDVVEFLQQLAEVLPCFCPGSLHEPGKFRKVALCSRSRPSPAFAPRSSSARLNFCFSLSLQLHPQLSECFRASCRLFLWLWDDTSRTDVEELCSITDELDKRWRAITGENYAVPLHDKGGPLVPNYSIKSNLLADRRTGTIYETNLAEHDAWKSRGNVQTEAAGYNICGFWT